MSKRLLFGCEPERLSNTELKILPGSCADASNNGVFENDYITIDLTVNGLNGLDTGSVVDGTSYSVYLVQNPTTGDVGAVVSESITYGGVTLPSGYTRFRKLPWGFVYQSGILPFHLSGWPLPYSNYTFSGDVVDYRVLNAGSSAAATAVSAASLVPDQARFVTFTAVVTGSGTARIGSNGICAQPVVNGGVYSVRVTSGRNVYYKTTGSALLSLYVLGYTQTERT